MIPTATELYITSFRANESDNDKIMIFKGSSGSYVGRIILTRSVNREPSHRPCFSAHGFLFVPISGNGPDTGAVRRYDVTKKKFPFDNFVRPSSQGPLGQPWYLTFGNTNPGTLEYIP